MVAVRCVVVCEIRSMCVLCVCVVYWCVCTSMLVKRVKCVHQDKHTNPTTIFVQCARHTIIHHYTSHTAHHTTHYRTTMAITYPQYHIHIISHTHNHKHTILHTHNIAYTQYCIHTIAHTHTHALFPPYIHDGHCIISDWNVGQHHLQCCKCVCTECQWVGDGR